MKLTDFDALSFDCYGTLIDWEAGLKSGLRQISDVGAAAPDTDTLLETYGEIEARLEREYPAMQYPDIIARSISETAGTHGITVPEHLAATVGASIPDWPVFPDSTTALARLAKRYRLIILSNVDRASFASSNERLGVSFDAIITAEDVGSYKPDPRNFEALLAKARQMGIARDRLLHVAQSLFHDHVPAKSAGLATVWIDRRGALPGHGATPIPDNAPTPDWTFTSMGALADAVEAEEP